MNRVVQTGVGPEFLRSEANGGRSREAVVLVNTGITALTRKAGTVLAQINIGALTAVATALAGNTGNGVMGAVTVDVGAQAGTWKVLIVEPGENAGNFVVERPDGVIDGQGDVGVAYDGGINFTLADGATDFVAGDGFTIVVTEAAATNEGRWVIHDPEGVNGSQNAAGVLYDDVVVPASGTAKGTAIVRDAEIITARLTWDDHDAGEKAAALAQLAALGLIARG
jgi:hypothetical protein